MKIFCTIFLIIIIMSLFAQNTWVKTYQPAGNSAFSYSVSNIRTIHDGGFVVNGSNWNSWEPMPDYQSGFLFKTDNSGNLLWSRTFGSGTGEENYYSTCFVENDVGKFIVSQVHLGYEADIYYVRISESGYFEEEIQVDNFVPYSMTINQNIFVGGRSGDYPAIQKISQNGAILQTMNINFSNNLYEGRINSIIAINDSFLICTGYIQIPQNDFVNAFVTKIDISGNEIWSDILIDFPSLGYCVVNSNQNILLTGSCSNEEYNGFLWLLDINGNTMWRNYKNNIQLSSRVLNGNSYLISDPNLYCIEEGGNTIWDSDFYPQGDDKNIDISNNEFIVFPGTYDYSSYVTITKTDLQGQVSINDNLVEVMNEFQISNYPNPFNPTTTIEFSIKNNSKVDLLIYNIKGQTIKTLVHNVFDKGDYSVIWNGDDESNKPVSSGVYLYNLIINGKTEAVKKCLLLK